MKDDPGTSALRLERAGAIAWCTIDRSAARNALTAGMYYGIERAVRLVNEDRDLAALIITGVGDVCAPGGDLGGRPEPGEELRDGLGQDVLPFRRGRCCGRRPRRAHVKRMLDERYGLVDYQTMFGALSHSPEPREGMRAFLEKRPPSWIPE